VLDLRGFGASPFFPFSLFFIVRAAMQTGGKGCGRFGRNRPNCAAFFNCYTFIRFAAICFFFFFSS